MNPILHPMPLRSLLCCAILALTSAATSQETPPEPPRRSTDAIDPVPLGDDGARVLRIHDVRDLVESVTDPRSGPDLVLRTPGSKPESAADETSSEELAVQRVARAMRNFVEPELEGPESITAIGGTHVVVVGRHTQHAWVDAFLARHRSNRKVMLLMETRIFDVPPAIYGKLGLEDGPRVVDAAIRSQLFPPRGDDEQADDWPVAVLMAPSIVFFPLQHATLSSQTQVAYVRDYELVEIEMDGETVKLADPVIDTVSDGVTLEGTLALTSPTAFGIDFKLTISELQRPIPLFETRIGTEQKVKIQLPSVQIVTVEAIATIEAGESIAFPAPQLRGAHPVMLITAKRVAPQTGENR